MHFQKLNLKGKSRQTNLLARASVVVVHKWMKRYKKKCKKKSYKKKFNLYYALYLNIYS